MPGTVLGGSIGNCVHVAGVVSFLSVAEKLGYKTIFLGAAVPVDEFVKAIESHSPDIVGVSYRLTPEVGAKLIADLADKLGPEGLSKRRFAFGGTAPVCEAVKPQRVFERLFTGLEHEDEVWAYLKGESAAPPTSAGDFGTTLLERLDKKSPYPILRHHFGLPSLEQTIEGVRQIADSQVLDVVSIAPDQNAQECFFRPETMDPEMDGAGGVPIRTAEDLLRIREAAQSGNHPLLRIYSGTCDLVKWADLSVDTVRNAWGAIPLCWYSTLDGRSKRTPEEAIAENQACMAWYGSRGIPVEVNEPHHWALRDAHDVITVVMAYIAAYNARAAGVSHYVAQYMFNTPAGITGAADLAKALAQIKMVESLHGPDFFSVRQVRAGLLHISPNLNRAKGQLAASTALALSVMPHIIHVVGYCEGDHAATADDVVESCEIVRGVIKNCWMGMPNMANAQEVKKRRDFLLSEAEVLLGAIKNLGTGDQDALTSPSVLASAIKQGILDAPHLRGNAHACGQLITRLTPEGVMALHPEQRNEITEAKRLRLNTQLAV